MARKIKRNQGITIIKKSNQLIEARYKFDVWETRVFLSVLANIRREDEDFKVYRIWYKDVIKAFGLRSAQSYGFLRDAARGMMRKVFNVSHLERGFQRETEYHIIRSINYLSEREVGRPQTDSQEYIDITVDPEMKPLLLQLQKNFTAYDLRNVVKLGAYPVRVYELLKQYESIGERVLDIEQIKRMFELTTEYPLFANFFQKIIQPAVRDINLHTDITITDLEKVKEGKKVVALRFSYKPKSGEELRKARGEVAPAPPLVVTTATAAEPPMQVSPLLELSFPTEKGSVSLDFETKKSFLKNDGLQMTHEGDLKAAAEMPTDSTLKDALFVQFQTVVVGEFGVTPSSFLDMLAGKTEAEVNQAIRVTRRAKAAGQIERSLAGFFVEALRSGFTDATEEATKKKTANDARLAARQKLEKQLENLLDEQADRLSDRIRELTTARPEIVDEAIEALRAHPFSKKRIDERENALARLLEVDDFRQDRVLRNLVKEQIFELHRSEFSEILTAFEPEVLALQAAIKQLDGVGE